MARFASLTGLVSFTPPACKPAARKGCTDISPGLSGSDTRGHRDALHRRTLKACEEIPVEQQAQPEEWWMHDQAEVAKPPSGTPYFYPSG